LPASAYDIVVSLGVIEHFNDPTAVVARHIELLKPGGVLILEVPNMAGRFNHWLLQKAKMHDLLEHHNLSVMSKGYFAALAKQFGLEIKFLDYVGGFDPGMVVHNHSYKKRWGRPMIMHALTCMEKLCRAMPSVARFLTRDNSPAYSNMLLGIMVKPKDAHYEV
jgi:SAM-dependent methyltransferase